MNSRRLVLPMAALTLVATPLGAQIASREAAPVEGANRIGGESSLVFIAGIAVVAAAIVLLSEDDDPVSP
ncbi:hypothetical protein [Qipengyuania spongiae]|uniref:Ferrochelatase n=1 Tax=Qipengyuania spongiae TaxID=2909673 RepID=A0ABY5T1J6_9SPHN|nr:hypothetical protein [Qipengyuania spongiae]UVI40450.1 hypothetical protein L1F33_05770 [Qipengyuania spongiae]